MCQNCAWHNCWTATPVDHAKKLEHGTSIGNSHITFTYTPTTLVDQARPTLHQMYHAKKFGHGTSIGTSRTTAGLLLSLTMPKIWKMAQALAIATLLLLIRPFSG
jgi:hypothetical protein